jgi:hypothetical protein
MTETATQTLIEAAEQVAQANLDQQDRWWAGRSREERAALVDLCDNSIQLRDLGEHGFPLKTRVIIVDRLRPSLADVSPGLRAMLTRLQSGA